MGDAFGQVLGQGIQPLGAQQGDEVFIGKEFLQALHHQQQALVCMLGFEDHLALSLHLFLVGAHKAVARSWRLYLRRIGRRRAELLAFFDQSLGLDDLAAFELAVFIGFLQQVAQVGAAPLALPLTIGVGVVWVVGAGPSNFQGGGERDGAALHAFDQALFALLQQNDDVAYVFRGEARLLVDYSPLTNKDSDNKKPASSLALPVFLLGVFCSNLAR